MSRRKWDPGPGRREPPMRDVVERVSDADGEWHVLSCGHRIPVNPIGGTKRRRCEPCKREIVAGTREDPRYG